MVAQSGTMVVGASFLFVGILVLFGGILCIYLIFSGHVSDRREKKLNDRKLHVFRMNRYDFVCAHTLDGAKAVYRKYLEDHPYFALRRVERLLGNKFLTWSLDNSLPRLFEIMHPFIIPDSLLSGFNLHTGKTFQEALVWKTEPCFFASEGLTHELDSSR